VVPLEREALPRAAAAGADHERGAGGDDVFELDRRAARRSPRRRGRGRRRRVAGLARTEQTAAALAVVGTVGIDEAATPDSGSTRRSPPAIDALFGFGDAAGEDVGQLLHVGTGDDLLAGVMALAQAG